VRETVATDTPARAATSVMVAMSVAPSRAHQRPAAPPSAQDSANPRKRLPSPRSASGCTWPRFLVEIDTGAVITRREQPSVDLRVPAPVSRRSRLGQPQWHSPVRAPCCPDLGSIAMTDAGGAPFYLRTGRHGREPTPHRAPRLGIGSSHARVVPTTDSLPAGATVSSQVVE
jgi:hypothetical protein